MLEYSSLLIKLFGHIGIIFQSAFMSYNSVCISSTQTGLGPDTLYFEEWERKLRCKLGGNNRSQTLNKAELELQLQSLQAKDNKTRYCKYEKGNL